jgi:hypothetical protein
MWADLLNNDVLDILCIKLLAQTSVCMFLRFSQILSSFLKSYDCCLFWFIISFCICWVTVIVICAHSVTSFIFCTIWSAFCTELLQIIQASTSQVVVEASCDTHETERRGSLLLRQSHDCLWLAQSWEAGLLSCSDYNLRTYKCTAQHSDSFAQLLCQFSVICCEHSLYNLQKLTDSFHRLLTNWVPQSETIVIKAHELDRNVVQMSESLILQSYSCTVQVLPLAKTICNYQKVHTTLTWQ